MQILSLKKSCIATQSPFSGEMALGSQLPIRLSPEIDARLTAVATRTGTSKSALIRHLIDTFLARCVQSDGSVSLPPNWAEILEASDGRSKSRVAEEPAEFNPPAKTRKKSSP